MIVGAHTIVIFFVVAFLFGLFPGPTYVLAIPGLALFLLNCVWAAGVVGILSTRFRDIPLIVTNAFMALFWLTPMVYEMDQMSGPIRTLISYNPLYHVIEVFRAPLLLTAPNAANWLVAIGAAVVRLAAIALAVRAHPQTHSVLALEDDEHQAQVNASGAVPLREPAGADIGARLWRSIFRSTTSPAVRSSSC